jgi:hypothetical protein
MTWISDTIAKNWFVDVGPGFQRLWTFERDLREAPPSEVLQLLAMYADVVLDQPDYLPRPAQGKAIQQGLNTKIASNRVELGDLVRFLHAVTLSEYALDSLALTPLEIRAKSLRRYAEDVGWPEATLLEIDRWWHASRSTNVHGPMAAGNRS